MDYIAFDVRRAIAAPTITGTAPNQTLQLTLPDCFTSYDSQGNPTRNSLIAPKISSDGKVRYNYNTTNSTYPTITVTYSVNSNGQLQRTQKFNATNASNTLIIANSVQGLSTTFNINQTSVVTFSIQFAPTMTTHDSTAAATTLTASTSIRDIH
jgi:hypothetical protein